MIIEAITTPDKMLEQELRKSRINFHRYHILGCEYWVAQQGGLDDEMNRLGFKVLTDDDRIIVWQNPVVKVLQLNYQEIDVKKVIRILEVVNECIKEDEFDAETAFKQSLEVIDP